MQQKNTIASRLVRLAGLRKSLVLILTGALALSMAACGNNQTKLQGGQTPSKDTQKATTTAAQEQAGKSQAGESVVPESIPADQAGMPMTPKDKDKKPGDAKAADDATTPIERFPSFHGKDFAGADVDESLFEKNDLTLLNFWFNGCSACVHEMPALEKFNAKLKEKGAEIIGVNVEVKDNEAALKEAKEILAKQEVTYRNIFINEGNEALAYQSQIFGFPTTILVDKKGQIIGTPIVGNLEDEKAQNQILAQLDDLKAGKDIAASMASEPPTKDPVIDLLGEENKLFTDHHEAWNKVFDKIAKDQAVQPEGTAYAEFLKTQMEAVKDSLTPEDIKTLEEDLKKIMEIEKQIEAIQQGQPQESAKP